MAGTGGLVAFMRRRIFFKFLGLTVTFGLVLSAVVLLITYPYRYRTLVSEVSAVIGVVATKLDRPLADLVADGRAGEAKRLLGLFGGFTYTVCVDYHVTADGPPAIFWPIPCERMMKPGETLVLPSMAAPGGYFSIRLSTEDLRAIMLADFAVLGLLSVAILLSMLLAVGVVFYMVINRPLGRLVSAMTRFERENTPEKVAWPTADEMGRVVARYNAMLDTEVSRVGELADAYDIISGSIRYAANIQQAILPPPAALEVAFADHFMLWEPRDVVGGDFYWVGPWGKGTLALLGDCTGHGVPGAFMTLITAGALERARAIVPGGDLPGLIQTVHRLVQETLGQHQPAGGTTIGMDGDHDGDPAADRMSGSDDGLELGACYLPPDGGAMWFAGARFSLFMEHHGDVVEIKGSKSGLGYRGIPPHQTYPAERLVLEPGQRFYMTTDGLVDQIGGPRRKMFGKKRFKTFLRETAGQPMAAQKPALLDALVRYQGTEARRDDVAVLGFRCPPPDAHRSGPSHSGDQSP